MTCSTLKLAIPWVRARIKQNNEKFYKMIFGICSSGIRLFKLISFCFNLLLAQPFLRYKSQIRTHINITKPVLTSKGLRSVLVIFMLFITFCPGAECAIRTPTLEDALSTPNLAGLSPTTRRRLQAVRRGEMPSDPIRTPNDPCKSLLYVSYSVISS